jgi:hypothetical protein
MRTGIRSPCSCAVVILLALAACTGSSRPEHRSMSDPGTDISKWSTFGWQAAGDAGTADEPMRMLDTNIRSAIEAELTRRGYVKSDSPQFLIAYDTKAQEKVKSNPFRIGIGMGSYGSNVGGSVNVGSPSVKSYQEGTLAVHAIDAAANKEVWYGTVSGEVDRANLDAAAVARVVALAMESFPVKSGGPEPALEVVSDHGRAACTNCWRRRQLFLGAAPFRGRPRGWVSGMHLGLSPWGSDGCELPHRLRFRPR